MSHQDSAITRQLRELGLGESGFRTTLLQRPLHPSPRPKRRILAAASLVICALWLSSASCAKPSPEPTTTPTAPEKKSDASEVLKETTGVLSGLYLYQTYLNIGLLADGKAERIYDEKAARAVLATVLTPLATVDKQLEKVAGTALTAVDREALTKLRSLVALLQKQGKDLTTFWDSGRPEDGVQYETTRQEAWKQINGLLGLDKK